MAAVPGVVIAILMAQESARRQSKSAYVSYNSNSNQHPQVEQYTQRKKKYQAQTIIKNQEQTIKKNLEEIDKLIQENKRYIVTNSNFWSRSLLITLCISRKKLALL